MFHNAVMISRLVNNSKHDALASLTLHRECKRSIIWNLCFISRNASCFRSHWFQEMNLSLQVWTNEVSSPAPTTRHKPEVQELLEEAVRRRSSESRTIRTEQNHDVRLESKEPWEQACSVHKEFHNPAHRSSFGPCCRWKCIGFENLLRAPTSWNCIDVDVALLCPVWS